jgi:hypothetical protein
MFIILDIRIESYNNNLMCFYINKRMKEVQHIDMLLNTFDIVINQ